MAEDAGEVWFYHLERSTADEVLPELLRRTLDRGWRALVRGVDAARLAAQENTLATSHDPVNDEDVDEAA